jgi:chromosome segregation ATPase
VRLGTDSLFAAAVEQLATLGIKPGDQNSAVDTITALKNELADKTQAQEKFQTDTKTLSRVVEVFKKTADQLPAYVPSLDAHVKTLNNTITNLNTELHAGELSLEWTTATKDDFQHQSTRLTKKLEGMCPLHCRLSLSYVLC